MSKTILNDDEIDLARYETAANELKSGNKKTTLWHKAYAESLGDGSATKAMYIKLRVEELRKEAVANAAIKMPSTEKIVETSSPIDFSQPQTTKFSLYDFLQIKATATDQEVNEAIRNAEIKLSEANIEEKNKTYSQTLINHAKDVLLNPVKRQKYTESIFKPRNIKKTASSEDLTFAYFWERFAAFQIDYFLVNSAGLVIVLFLLIAHIINVNLINALGVLPLVYYVSMESSDRMATFGKQLMGLKVMTSSYKQISIGQGLGRHLSKILSALPFLIGFLMQPFNSKRQGLHDMLASTVVIRTRKAKNAATIFVISIVTLFLNAILLIMSLALIKMV